GQEKSGSLSCTSLCYTHDILSSQYRRNGLLLNLCRHRVSCFRNSGEYLIVKFKIFKRCLHLTNLDKNAVVCNYNCVALGTSCQNYFFALKMVFGSNGGLF